MGNLSNPSINRWGLNLFWYRYWYNDKQSQAYIQQDNIFEKLLYTYILFGILTPHFPFISPRWHFNFLSLEHSKMKLWNEKYYREVEIKGTFLKELTLLRLRSKVKHFYHSRIWILRFQNWILMNFYSFQPLKKKLKRKKIVSFDINTYKIFPKKNFITIKQLKLVLIHFFKTQKPFFLNYQF